jgi:hypothetical protein
MSASYLPKTSKTRRITINNLCRSDGLLTGRMEAKLSALNTGLVVIMTKIEFQDLFQRVLNAAAEDAEAHVALPIPRSFLIKLHAFGLDERTISVDEAVNRIYLGSNLFYRVIDVAIGEVLPRESVAFVRVSGHSPDEFSATWDPGGFGPFKHIVFGKIVDRRVHPE